MTTEVIDSHTEGEPTRVIVAGAPDLGPGDAVHRREVFRDHHDDFRRAVILEPRGFDAIVGALVLAPTAPTATAQVIFFNNAGVLWMCGHGLIGVVATWAFLGKIGPGRHVFETPAGEVAAELGADGAIAIDNVFSYRYRKNVPVATTRHGLLHGDIAWGGNWFFLIDEKEHGRKLDLGDLELLTDLTWDVRQALERDGIKGRDGQEIDHIELFGPAQNPGGDSRNFVLCPGKAFDRSPCGTGTSAKLACLAADGKLAPGAIWHQESIVGGRFRASYRAAEHNGTLGVIPTLSGRAFITARSTLLFDPADPFRHGIR